MLPLVCTPHLRAYDFYPNHRRPTSRCGALPYPIGVICSKQATTCFEHLSIFTQVGQLQGRSQSMMVLSFPGSSLFSRSTSVAEHSHNDPPPHHTIPFGNVLLSPGVPAAASQPEANIAKQPETSLASPEEGHWVKADRVLQARDVKVVHRWNAQVDSLLVFAGLFSAVVTAFNVETYKRLQPDATQQILQQISQQLADLPRAMQPGSPMHLTLLTPTSASAYRPPLSAVWINSMWFSSLVCSLIAASLGILAKQWLDHYVMDDYTLPQERLRVRQHRFEGLERWKVPGIIAFLPLLLRVALALFLVGLVIFLWTLHPTVTTIVGTPVGLWLIFYAATSVLPAIVANCPYKSPEASIFYTFVRLYKKGIGHWNFISWDERETALKSDSTLDWRVLTTMDKLFAGVYLDTIVRGCTRQLDGLATMDLIDSALRHRLQLTASLKFNIADELPQRVSNFKDKSMQTFLQIVMDCLERGIDSHVTPSGQLDPHFFTKAWVKRGLRYFEYLIRAMNNTSGYLSDEELTDFIAKMLKLSPIGLSERLVLTILGTRPTLCQLSLSFAVPRLCLVSASKSFGMGDFLIKDLIVLLTLACKTDTLDCGFQHHLDVCAVLLQGSSHIQSRTTTTEVKTCIEAYERLSRGHPHLCDKLQQALLALMTCLDSKNA